MVNQRKQHETNELSISEMESLLTSEFRSAFKAAVQDAILWKEAKLNAQKFLQSRGVTLSDRITVAFLDVELEGDRLKFFGADNKIPILDMYCPPTFVWWHFCRKIARVCEKKTVIIDPITGKKNVIESNCYLVCEEYIWDPELSLPKRPPWPPIPPPIPPQ